MIYVPTEVMHPYLQRYTAELQDRAPLHAQSATLYDDELNHILDRLIPVRRLDRRQRHSDPWFDNECRAASLRNVTRQYERTYAAASRRAASSMTVSPTAAAAASTASAAKAATENAGLENVGPNRMGGNRRTGKRRTKIPVVEKAGL